MHVWGCRCFDSIRFNGLNRFVSSIIMRSMTPLLQACLHRRHFGDSNRNGWIFMDVDRIPIWSMFWCRFNWNWFKHHLFIYFHLITKIYGMIWIRSIFNWQNSISQEKQELHVNAIDWIHFKCIKWWRKMRPSHLLWNDFSVKIRK